MWFVGFPTRTASPRRTWWSLFTRPGYRHVMAWRADEETGGTLLLDPLAGGLVAAHVPVDVGRFTRHMLVENGVWTLAWSPPWIGHPPARRPPIFPLTCTSIVMHAIGLRAWSCLTPYQLARRLRARGALPVLPTTSPQPRS